jgi:hypothetical protein
MSNDYGEPDAGQLVGGSAHSRGVAVKEGEWEDRPYSGAPIYTPPVDPDAPKPLSPWLVMAFVVGLLIVLLVVF